MILMKVGVVPHRVLIFSNEHGSTVRRIFSISYHIQRTVAPCSSLHTVSLSSKAGDTVGGHACCAFITQLCQEHLSSSHLFIRTPSEMRNSELTLIQKHLFKIKYLTSPSPKFNQISKVNAAPSPRSKSKRDSVCGLRLWTCSCRGLKLMKLFDTGRGETVRVTEEGSEGM